MKNADSNVLIYLPHDKFGCSTVRDCQIKCERRPQSCRAPNENELNLQDGIWSKEPQNNPFANYFKVNPMLYDKYYIPYSSLNCEIDIIDN